MLFRIIEVIAEHLDRNIPSHSQMLPIGLCGVLV